MSSRVARFLVIALAPLVVLSTAGRRLAPRIRTAAWRAALAGMVSGLAALGLFALWWQPPAWSVLLFFLFIGIHAVMGVVEVAVASRVLGGGRRRVLGAIGGAALGHVVWHVGWFVLDPIRDSANEVTLIVLTIIVPSALLGACGAAVGAALAGRRDP
jgi:hypothetical protein